MQDAGSRNLYPNYNWMQDTGNLVSYPDYI